MSVQSKVILWFSEVGKDDVPLVGGKGANLGELTRAGIPVPPGFVVTADTYHAFIESAHLVDPIRRVLDNLNVDDPDRLQTVAARARRLIFNAEMPKSVANAILDAYRQLGSPSVAVRSSATAEDLPEASFAGQQSTYLNILGEQNVLHAVKNCWASLFERRAIFYRAHQNYDHFSVGIAVPVQKMVQSKTSGVMFTVEPVSNDPSKIVVEAILGLGEAIVSGAITPDLYLLDKASLTILERKVAPQDWKLVRNLETRDALEPNERVTLAPHERARQKLSDEEIRSIASIAKRIEAHYGSPQDIEWAQDADGFFIVQTRSVTTIGLGNGAGSQQGEMIGKVLVAGSPASPGVSSGPVRLLPDASHIDDVKAGDVLVAATTNPDFVPGMKRAAAVVTTQPGRASHAALVCQELGIPCVISPETGIRVLKHGQIVTVDGTTGRVLEGIVKLRQTRPAKARRIDTSLVQTKLLVNLAEPEVAELVAKRDVDGVGLLRAEFIVSHFGEHPRYILDQGRGDEFVAKLATSVAKIAGAFSPRIVVYRTTDFKTNELRRLRGGDLYEGEEDNPLLGYRGAARYLGDLEVFRLELAAIRQVRRRYKNLWVMIPFVRTPKELQKTKNILFTSGLRRSKSFQLWMMAEVPANVLLLDQFLDVGIDGVSIGSNDLTQLMLGVDRENPKLAKTADDLNPAVLLALEQIIATCKRRGIACSICGEAPSLHPELTRRLLEWGISSISVSPDKIDATRRVMADFLREQARGTEKRSPRRRVEKPHTAVLASGGLQAPG